MERSAAIVGVDIGTTGTKAVAYAPDGRILAHETREYPLRSPLRDLAEQDPDAALVYQRLPGIFGRLYGRLEPEFAALEELHGPSPKGEKETQRSL